MRSFLFLLCCVLPVGAEEGSSSMVNPEIFKDRPEFSAPKNQFPDSQSRFLPPEAGKQSPPPTDSEGNPLPPAENKTPPVPPTGNLIGLPSDNLLPGKEKPPLSPEEINKLFPEKETEAEIYPQAIGFDRNSVLFRKKYNLPQDWYQDMDKYGEEFRKFCAEMHDKRMKEATEKAEMLVDMASILEKKAHEDALFYFEQKKPALYEEYQELLTTAETISPEELKKIQEEFFARNPGLRDDLRTIREIRAEKHLMMNLKENHGELYSRLVKLEDKFKKLSYKQKMQLVQKLLREGKK
jgi:hypothetical protein